MARAATSQSVDLGLISQVESYQKTLKMVFTASLLGAQQIRDSVENKSASLLVVFLGKALNEMPSCLCGRQVVGPRSLPVVVAPIYLRNRKPSVSADAVYAHLPE